MKVTDEMVSTAVAAYWQSGGKIILSDTHMRAAIEAALGQKQGKKYSAADNLLNWAKAKATENNDSLRADLLSNAACIEDLAAALKLFCDIDGEGAEDFGDDTKVIVKFGRTTNYALKLGYLRRARATLERWGLK